MGAEVSALHGAATCGLAPVVVARRPFQWHAAMVCAYVQGGKLASQYDASAEANARSLDFKPEWEKSQADAAS